MVVPMEQWAGQAFQDKSADWSVVMLSDHNEKYSDRMERSYKAFDVNFELRFPFPLSNALRIWWRYKQMHSSSHFKICRKWLDLNGVILAYWRPLVGPHYRHQQTMLFLMGNISFNAIVTSVMPRVFVSQRKIVNTWTVYSGRRTVHSRGSALTRNPPKWLADWRNQINYFAYRVILNFIATSSHPGKIQLQ